MVRIVLVSPRIPNNTGAIIRLCANVGAELHLVEPLGFDISSSALKRAGLDYHEYVDMKVHETFDDCMAAVGQGARCLAFTSHANVRYDSFDYTPDDVLIFGCEPSGLSAQVLGSVPEQHQVYLPMQPNNRSINLSNAVAIVTYEAWRQHGFQGAAPPKHLATDGFGEGLSS